MPLKANPRGRAICRRRYLRVYGIPPLMYLPEEPAEPTGPPSDWIPAEVIVIPIIAPGTMLRDWIEANMHTDNLNSDEYVPSDTADALGMHCILDRPAHARTYSSSCFLPRTNTHRPSSRPLSRLPLRCTPSFCEHAGPSQAEQLRGYRSAFTAVCSDTELRSQKKRKAPDSAPEQAAQPAKRPKPFRPQFPFLVPPKAEKISFPTLSPVLSSDYSDNTKNSSTPMGLLRRAAFSRASSRFPSANLGCGYFGPKGLEIIKYTLKCIEHEEDENEDSKENQLFATISGLIDTPNNWDEYDDGSNLISPTKFTKFILIPHVAASLIAEDLEIKLREAVDILLSEHYDLLFNADPPPKVDIVASPIDAQQAPPRLRKKLTLLALKHKKITLDDFPPPPPPKSISKKAPAVEKPKSANPIEKPPSKPKLVEKPSSKPNPKLTVEKDQEPKRKPNTPEKPKSGMASAKGPKSSSKRPTKPESQPEPAGRHTTQQTARSGYLRMLSAIRHASVPTVHSTVTRPQPLPQHYTDNRRAERRPTSPSLSPYTPLHRLAARGAATPSCSHLSASINCKPRFAYPDRTSILRVLRSSTKTSYAVVSFPVCFPWAYVYDLSPSTRRIGSQAVTAIEVSRQPG
ncbi:hypothetical protein C8F04DRAFT_1284539 [Mycena alexandri]|uniref:Restriction of telomere capping protein 4 C-terminal domain-containing protein n=1 Tax=Mycena alexandri TaxID=1745969 RepID=A0AAD6RVA9_9AGAR|nr:hypothetical protein C8F04DRAFT_1284539 [Mycena alexandri]